MPKKYLHALVLAAICGQLSSMDQKDFKHNVVMQQLMHKKFEPRGNEHKDVLHAELVEKTPHVIEFQERNFCAFPRFEYPDYEKLSARESTAEPAVEVGSGLLSKLNPVNWVSAAYGYFFSKQTQLDIKKIDWQNPLKIEQAEKIYVVAGGDKRYVTVIDTDNMVDVMDIGSREKVVCYEARSKILSTNWSDDYTWFAVREETKITFFDIKNDNKTSKSIETTAHDRSYFWQQTADDVRYVIMTDKKIIIEELLTGNPVKLKRKGHVIKFFLRKKHAIAVRYDDNTFVIYDMRKNYQPMVQLKAQEYMVSFPLTFLERFSENYMSSLCDDVLRIFDISLGKEIYSQAETDKNIDSGYFDFLSKTKCFIDGEHEDNIHDISTGKVTALKVEDEVPHLWDMSVDMRYFSYRNLAEEDWRLYDITRTDSKPIKVFVLDTRNRGLFSINNWFVTPIASNKVELYDCAKNTSSEKPHDGKYFSRLGWYSRYFAWSVDAKTVMIFDTITQKDKELKFEHDIDGSMITSDEKHGHLMVPCSDKKLYVYEIARDMRITTIDLKSNVKRMQFSNDGAWFTVVPHERPDTLMVYDIKKNYAPAIEKPLAFDGEVKGIDFKYSDVCTVNTDAMVYIYSLKMEK